jgi:glyoxylate reductase
MTAMRKRVLVTRRIPEKALAHLRSQTQVTLWEEDLPPERERLRSMIGPMHGLLCLLTDAVDHELLLAAPRLEVVSTMSVGVDHIDLEACHERGIPVGYTPGVLTDATADFTLALILALGRRLLEACAYAASGQWRTWSPTLLLGRDLSACTVGILGMGRIGAAVGRRLSAFGARLVFHDDRPEAARGLDFEAGYQPFDELIASSDIITIHLPLTEATRHLIGKGELERMPSKVLLINTARGAIVDTESLVSALRDGRIGGAALDVTDPEPLPPNHALFGMDNCIVTPHVASAGEATRERMAEMAVSNLLAGLRGDRLPHPAA